MQKQIKNDHRHNGLRPQGQVAELFSQRAPRSKNLPNCGARSKMQTPANCRTDLERLEAGLIVVAKLVAHDPAYAPIFARLDAEIKREEAKLSNDIVAYARLVAAQRATC